MWGMRCWIKTAGICSSPYGVKPEPNIHPRGVRRAVSGAVARRPRPDRRLDRIAHHGRRSWRPELSLVGGDGLSPHQHGRRPALRKIRRSLRSQGRAASGDRGVSRRLCPLRHCAEHAATHRLSRARRRGRRRADRHHHRRDRRPHPAARARPLSGLLRRGVRGCPGGVLGVPPIVAPLVGVFSVVHLSWGWISYTTLPTGTLALAVIAAVLPSGSTRRQHAVDYVGALLLTAALSAVILFTGLG